MTSRPQYEDGILELTIPIAEEVRPKRISIGTGRKAIISQKPPNDQIQEGHLAPPPRSSTGAAGFCCPGLAPQ